MYDELKETHIKFITKTNSQITNLRSKLKKVRDDKEKALRHLKRSQEEVIKPLIKECTERERKLNEYRSLTNNMKK